MSPKKNLTKRLNRDSDEESTKIHKTKVDSVSKPMKKTTMPKRIHRQATSSSTSNQASKSDVFNQVVNNNNNNNIKTNDDTNQMNKDKENKRNSIIKMANGTDLDLEGSDAEDSFVFRSATTRVSPKPGAQTSNSNSMAAVTNASSSNTNSVFNASTHRQSLDRANLATSGSGPSQCSTTSDINSDDDAISLASRLSQIVYEEQSKQKNELSKLTDNNNKQQHHHYRDFDGENTSADASATELDDNGSRSSSNEGFSGNCSGGGDFVSGKMRTRSSTFKLTDATNTFKADAAKAASASTVTSTSTSATPTATEHIPTRQQDNLADNKEMLPDIQVTKCSIYNKLSLPRQNKSVDSNANDINDNEFLQQSQLVDLPDILGQRSPNDPRLPERGDLRTLESSRQQHQQSSPTTCDSYMCSRRPRSNTTIDNRSSTFVPNANLQIWTNYNANQYSHNNNSNTSPNNSPQPFSMNSPIYDSDQDFLHQDDGQQGTINIRRSTWTLSEFDDVYNNKSPNNNNSNDNLHANNNKQRKTSNCQKPLEHLNSTTSLGGQNESSNYLMSPARSNGNLHGISIDPAQSKQSQNNYKSSQFLETCPTIQCYQSNLNSSGYNANGDNLLVKATINNQQESFNPMSTTTTLSPNANLNTNSNTNTNTNSNLNTLDCKCDNEQQRRGSFTHSIVSFANSIESGILTPVLARRFPNWSHKSKKHKSSNGKDDPRMQQWSQDPNNNNYNGQSGNDSDGFKKKNGKNGCNLCDIFPYFARYVPIFEWLPNYKSSYLYGDLMAGLAVAVLNISTSLSAAVVAETNLGVAFKTSIVNTFFYAILCSSRHTSFGSYSIMSQMLLVSVQRALSDELILSRLNLGPTATWKAHEYERWHLNIIVMFTFLIGLIQLVCGLLKLGYIVASFIPEALSSSMIAATAFTMAIGQLANMCGTTNKILWSIEKNTTVLWADLKEAPVDITDLFANLFRWIQQIALLIRYYDQINLICVLISISSVTILFLNQYFIQKQLKTYFKRDILIPVEMILLIIMIAISHFMDLQQTFQVPTCGPIEIDFNLPEIPNLRLIRELWFQALATALISYTTVHIMSKTYSNKCNYEVDSNQELIACGAGNLIGGLVDAMPAAASFSRTAGQVEAGGQTQMASIVNCIVLLLITYGLGQHVAALPVSVMAATLFYGFVRMMSKMSDVFKYWRICKVDFSIWCVTFVAILATDLVTGFVYGFIFSIITLLYRAQNRRSYMLGPIPGSPDVFVPLIKYPMATELNGCKIFQYCGPINYVSEELFESLLRAKTRVDVKQLLKQTSQNEHNNQRQQISNYDQNFNLTTHIILDFSMISFIDSSGLNILKKIIEDYQQVNIIILIASMASHVARIVKSDPKLWSTYKNRFYVTLSDAVHSAMRHNRYHFCQQQQQQQQQQKQPSLMNQNHPQNNNINNNNNNNNHKYQHSNQDQGQRMMMITNSNNVECVNTNNNNNNNYIINNNDTTNNPKT